MEIKLKREELVKIITGLKMVEELSKGTILEFSRLMKVKEEANDPKSLIEGLQQRIADIFCQEGEGYEDYLQLPKFRALNTEQQTILKNLFANIWKNCQANKLKEDISRARKEVDQIFNCLQTTQEAQSFHLELLRIFQDSSLSHSTKVKTLALETEKKITLEKNGNHSVNGSSSQQGNNPVQGGMFPCFPFPMNSSYPKVEAQEGMGYIMQGKQSRPLFEVPRFPMAPPFFAPQFLPNGHDKKVEQISQLPSKSKSSPQAFEQESLPFLASALQSYKFIQCACEGASSNVESFQCVQCRYSYHAKCLNLSGASREGICPFCNLKKETVFCKVLQEPLRFYWHQQRSPDHGFKDRLTEQESQQIIEAKRNGLDCQIRFLKIDGKSLKGGRRDCGVLRNQGGVLQKQAKYSEITLPQFRDQREPISINIELKSEEDEIFSPKLYFFAVFLVSFRKIDEIVMELFESNNYFQENYYEQFFDQSDKVFVKFEVNNGDELLQYPVRGSLCKHPETFDFKMFLELITDLKRDRETDLLCPICSQVCKNFQYDSLIYHKINDYEQYGVDRPEGIQIHRNGECKWVKMPRFVFEEDPPSHGEAEGSEGTSSLKEESEAGEGEEEGRDQK